MNVQKVPVTVINMQHVPTTLDPSHAAVTQAIRVMDRHALVMAHVVFHYSMQHCS